MLWSGKIENALQNFDEFVSLKAWQQIDPQDKAAVEAFKAQHYLSDEGLETLKATEVLPERKVQDYRSTYNDIRDWLRRENDGNGTELNSILPKMSPLNPKYLTLKQRVFQKIAAFVEKFKGVGGEI